MVDVDPLSLDAQVEQGVALGGEVLLIGRASGVPDKQRAHGCTSKGGPGQAAGCDRLGHRATPDCTSQRPPHLLPQGLVP